MTRDGRHRKSVSLSGPIYRTLSAWAYVGDIAVSAALEIAVRQWHGRIAPGVIEEWVAAGAARSRDLGLGRAPPRRMVSVGRDAFEILGIRSGELGVPRSLIAEFCAACRVQRVISYREVLDHVDATEQRTERARAAHLERRASASASAKIARLEHTVDARTERTIARRRQRGADARAFEDRLERTRRDYLERADAGRGAPAGSAAGGRRGGIDGRVVTAGSAAGGRRGGIDGRGTPTGSAAGGRCGGIDGRGTPAGSAAGGRRGEIDDEVSAK